MQELGEPAKQSKTQTTRQTCRFSQTPHTAAKETPTSTMTDSTTPPPPPPPTDDDSSSAAAAENKCGEKEEKEDGDEEKGDVAMPEAPAVAQAAVAPPSATVAAVAVAAPAQTGGGKRSPSDFLKTVLGRSVVVKLNSGIDYRGELLHTNRGRLVLLLVFGPRGLCEQMVGKN